MKSFRKLTAVALVLTLLMGIVMISAQAAEPQMVILIDQTGTDGDNNIRISDNETLKPGEVLTRKSVQDLGDGTFEITLEAIGRRFEQMTEIEAPVQYDVVFVLDYSTSMDDNNKYNNMRTAAADTINKIVERNTAEYYNRVAVVKYANGASTLINWTKNTVTAQTLVSAREARTNIMSGMDQAYKLLSARTGADANRPAIIVLMTDGQPNGYYDDVSNTNNTTTTNQKTSGSTADANVTSVVKTIQNMAYIKALMSGTIMVNGDAHEKLAIYTVGFDLMSFVGAQRAYAYAVMNPDLSTTLSPTTSTVQAQHTGSTATTNRTAYITAMNNIRAQLSGHTNPVSATQDAGSNLNEIANAFTRIIETITYDDPLNGNITLFDQIDSTFNVDMKSFIRNGTAVSNSNLAAYGISLNNGELRWNFRLASFYDSSTGAVAVGDNFISTLQFVVSAKVGAEYLEHTLYTNTSSYNDNTSSSKNRAEFTPLDINPFYRNVNGGKVTQPLRATGWVTLIHTYEMPEIEISLGKLFEANSANGSKLPQTIDSFEFSLALADDTVVATLNLTNAENTDSGIFTWTSGATFDAVENQILYLTESLPTANWRGLINGQDLTIGKVAFAKVNSDATVTYLQNNSNSVTNIFNQDPEPVTIFLRKFFVGDLNSFEQLHPFDTSTETHSDACYEAVPRDCEGCENCMIAVDEEQVLLPKVYADDKNPSIDSESPAPSLDAERETEDDSDAIVGDNIDTTTDEGNKVTSDDSSNDTDGTNASDETAIDEGTFVGAEFYVNTQCYEWVLRENCGCEASKSANEWYAFSFTLINKNGTVIQEATISLSSEEIISLMNNEDLFEQIRFQVPVSELKNGPFEIIETNSNHTGWTVASPIYGIEVPELGGANINPLIYEMTNTFGGFFVPEISFGKEVIDAWCGEKAENYIGTFDFSIRGTGDFATLSDTATVTAQAGFGHWIDRYTQYLNATGSIVVTENNPNIEGMDYDRSEVVFTFDEGQLISVTKDAREIGEESNVVFSNNYQEPRYPQLELTKLTTNDSPNELFTFVFEVEGGSEIADIKMGAGSKIIDLDTNFTGTIKVSELDSKVIGWTYDTREITLTYKDGLLVIDSPEGEISAGLVGTATFINVYEKPEVTHPPVVPAITDDPEDGNNPGDGDDPGDGNNPENGAEPEDSAPVYNQNIIPQSTSSDVPLPVEPFTLDDPSVPLSELFIEDTDVPLSEFLPVKEFELVDIDDSNDTEIIITDDSVPLGMMPQTGLSDHTDSLILGLITSLLVTFGLGGLITRIKRNENDDE